MTSSTMNIDPYETLGVESSATSIEIKRAYKKLSLKYHPDKVQQKGGELDATLFPKIQFAYSILSDDTLRRRYDTTGSMDSFGDYGETFDWREFFDSTGEKITAERIEEDRAMYQGSEEEQEEILLLFVRYEGDFLRIFESVPHLDFTEALEARVFQIIEDGINSGTIELDKSIGKTWEKYKKSRKTKVKQQLKKLAKEAKEAEKLQKQMKIEKGPDLGTIIKRKNKSQFDSVMAKFEAKYGGGSKRSTSDDMPDEEEFLRIREGLLKKKKKN